LGWAAPQLESALAAFSASEAANDALISQNAALSMRSGRKNAGMSL
jgi:hypothetical protein